MGIMDTLASLINVALFASSLRMTIPVLFATLGGLFFASGGPVLVDEYHVASEEISV